MNSCKEHKNKHKLEDPYTEAELQGKIGRWLNDGNQFQHVCEVKCVAGGTLSFSRFEDQQLPCLKACASKKGFYYKMTDASVGAKPFDYFCLNYTPAYVACQFWKNRQQEIIYFMSIDKVYEIKKTGAKSITEKDFINYGFAKDLSQYKKGIKKK